MLLQRSLMSVPKPPTAVYVTDPPIALGLMNEARNMAMEIPQDLSVVGFDDRDARNYVYPKMTAVCQDARQLGYEAFAGLAQAVKGGNGNCCQNRITTTWLEINNSTGQPPAKSVGILPDGTRVKVAGQSN